MTAKYWEDFANARRARPWQEWLLAIVIALGLAGIITLVALGALLFGA